MKISLVAAQLFYENRQKDRRTDDETDMTKLIVIFRNFASSPDKDFVCFMWISSQVKIILQLGFCNSVCLLRDTS
jgi:hypothetical protein